MNLLAALLIADNVRQRAEQGDCPTIPAQPVETLENVVMELQRALARDAVAGAIVEVKKERDELRAALTMLYDKWENGDPCYQDADEANDSLGNAFKLTDEEEKQILALIPAAK